LAETPKVVKVEDPAGAEQKKNEGNEALKAGKVDEAISLYSEAIEMHKNEAILTNRAMAYIKQRKYKEALLDCEQALYLNSKFSKAHLRAYACHLASGDLEKAKRSAELAKQCGDATAD